MTDTVELTLVSRIAALREDAIARGGSFVAGANPFQRDVALWRSLGEGRSRVQVRARLLSELARLAEIDIGPDWTLAGEHLTSGHDRFAFQTEPDEATLERIGELGVAADDVEDVRRAVRLWIGSGEPHAGIGEVTSEHVRGDGDRTASPDTCAVYRARGWIENHSIRDYGKVLRIGFAGIRRQIEARLRDADIAHPEYPRRENFWKAGLSICDAGMLIGKRYAERAEERALATGDPEERQRLERMAETCSRVPAEGARTFFEAVQSLWLAHVLTCGEDGINANSIGRLDQILYPYYRTDLEAAILAREEAIEIMAELACKLYLDYDVQAITLGGVDRDGNDAVNDLSHVILEATGEAGFVRDLSLRVHRDTPDDFLELAARLIAPGGGIPFMFNDDCFIQALTDRGIALADARDYAPIGCIELTVPGRANPRAVSGWFNSTKCMELALFDGVDPHSGEQVGPRTGMLTGFACFDDFYTAYCHQVEFFARRMVYHCNRGEIAQEERGPLPCWSVLTDDCIDRGRDITAGGAVYDYHSVCFLGTATTADSMCALKQLVFDGRIDAGQLLQALRDDFDGWEPMRQQLLNQAPKYGNDCTAVDELARRLDEDFIDLMDEMRSPVGGRYHVHLFSFHLNIPFGKAVGGTPDGRRAGEPLAYSLSAQQGRDENGVTALINSVARMPHNRAGGASAAIIELDPDVVEGEAGVRRLLQLIRTAIDVGVGQMQWNITSVERLRKAQEDPEKYGNISVRVAGYSQMFRLIGRELQDHIIARTKHRS